MKGRAISKVAAAVAVVAAVLVVGSAGLLARQPSSNSSTSISSSGVSTPSASTYRASSSQTTVGSETTTSSVLQSSSLSSATSSALPAFDFNAAMTSHLANLSSRNVQGAVTAYSNDAVVQWKGQTLSPYGMAGTYSGVGSIRQLFGATIGQMQSLALTVESFNSTAPSNGSAPSTSAVQADAQFTGAGASQMLGKFNITVDAQLTYQYLSNAWVITQETWNFVNFHSQATGGATTFPQWQITGPPLPQRYSESPFKNWVYFYGGAAATVAVVGYISTLPLFFYVKKKRSLNKNGESLPRQA